MDSEEFYWSHEHVASFDYNRKILFLMESGLLTGFYVFAMNGYFLLYFLSIVHCLTLSYVLWRKRADLSLLMNSTDISQK